MAGSSSLQIKKIRVELTPPSEDAVIVGYLPLPEGGRVPIYEHTIVRAGPHEPKLDKDGRQVWARHGTTGEEIYPRWQRKAVSRTRQVIPVDQGNGNLEWIEYTPPTADELAAQEKRRSINSLQDKLAEALYESGMDPATLIASLKQQAAFPRQAGGNKWTLSDGSEVRGTKAEALKAEAALGPAEPASEMIEH